MKKKYNEERRTVIFRMNEELYKQIKIHLVISEQTMQDYLTKLVEEDIKNQEKQTIII